MRRSRIIALSIVLASVGAILPIVCMLHISWVIAVSKEQERLSDFAGRVLERANLSYRGATEALAQIGRSTAIPCSEEHVTEMRLLAIDSSSVEEIGYFENGLLKCTSWGPVRTEIRLRPGDYVSHDGVAITTHMQPLVTRSKPKMALQIGQYNALVEPSRFVDVIADEGIGFAIGGTNGKLISQRGISDRYVLGNFISLPNVGISEDSLFATARKNGWTAVAAEPRVEMLSNLRREQMLLVPVGLFIAAFIVGLVIWSSRRQLSPLAELSIAVQKREFLVHYQPIIELATGRCIGAEALVRWRQADGTMVAPDTFIPLAEESGLIMPITDQVVASVIRDLHEVLVEDRSLHIAVNLSAQDIKSGRILPVLGEMLLGTDIRPEQIWLEATERGFMDIEPARATITRARELGHSVAIDDFGTGYSSLQYLQGLPLDALKIDKSFIDTIGRDTARSLVTPHIIEMARELGLFIVAEGVETREQADYLAARKVDFAQGWFFAKPLPAAEFIAFQRQRRMRYGAAPATFKKVAA